MAEKKLKQLTIRLDDQQRADLERQAGILGMTLADMVRQRSLQEKPATKQEAQATPATSEQMEVHHIDDLGEDPLRSDNGALKQ
jgi:hypothetical protein